MNSKVKKKSIQNKIIILKKPQKKPSQLRKGFLFDEIILFLLYRDYYKFATPVGLVLCFGTFYTICTLIYQFRFTITFGR
jgi:hypothetical protein